MTLTERQLERRRHSLGGSDIAVLLGHNTHKTEYDLWLEKKQGIVIEQDNEAMEFGRVVEPGIATWAARKLGVSIRRNVFRVDPKRPFHANLDAVVVGEPEAIEVKFTGFRIRDLWGEPGTDVVPHAVTCQCQWQAGRAELDRVHVAAGLTPSFGANRLSLYRVERHEPLIDMMDELALKWWDEFVMGDRVPPALPSESVYKRAERKPGLEREVSTELVKDLLHARKEGRRWKTELDQLKAELQKQLLDPETGEWAEVGILPSGQRVTYFQHYRKPGETKGGFFRRLQLPKEVR